MTTRNPESLPQDPVPDDIQPGNFLERILFGAQDAWDAIFSRRIIEERMKENPMRRPGSEKEGYGYEQRFRKNLLERITGIGGELEVATTYPPRPESIERARQELEEFAGFADELRAEGAISDELVAYRFGSMRTFYKELGMGYFDERINVLASVIAPRVSDVNIVSLRDDKMDPNLLKRFPVGVSTVDPGDFVDISLSAREEPRSILLVGKDSLQTDFILGTAMVANNIDTFTVKPQKIALYLLADPTRDAPLYGAFAQLPRYFEKRPGIHRRRPTDLFTDTRLALMNLPAALSRTPFHPGTTDTYAMVCIPRLDTMIENIPKFVEEEIVPLLDFPDPRIHVFATMGHSGAAQDYMRGRLPVSFNTDLFGAIPRNFHLSGVESLSRDLHALPPHQFATNSGETFWAVRPL